MLSVVRHSLTPRIAVTLCVEVVTLGMLCWIFPSPILSGEATSPILPAAAKLIAAGCGVFLVAVFQFSFWSFGLYSRHALYDGQTISKSLGLAIVFALGMLAAPYLLFHLCLGEQLEIPLERLTTVLLGFTTFVAFERYAVLRIFGRRSHLGSILVIGTGAATSEAVHEMRAGGHGGFGHFAGILTTNPREVGGSIHGCEVAGTVDKIRDFVDYHRTSTIVISLPRHSDDLPADYLVRCKLSGIRVLYVGEFYESMTRKVLLEDFSSFDFLYRGNLVMTRFRWFAKSLFEKSVALCLLVPALPVMLLAAILVKLTSPGAVLYRQVRMGQNGRTFTLLKFRSMGVDAEKDGARWAEQNDPRVTRWGRMMRTTRIDELPQLINILRGDMSFAGPRPERPEFVKDLMKKIPHYHQRHIVRPGLTGWAQVAFHYGSSIEETAEKLRYDLYYVKHMSLGFDFLIVLNTIRTVLYNGGAR